MSPLIPPALFSHDAYRLFNNELEASLKGAPKRPASLLLDTARGHLRRARRVHRVDAGRSIDALQDAVAAMLEVIESGR
jgi:3-phenylpropionate/cinnamic acid dioxygenase small subunit